MIQKFLTIISIIAIALSGEAATKKNSRRPHIESPKSRVAQQASRHSNDYDGIDVSSYQKDIDWEKVCADKRIKFVYIKATEGSTYTSPHFEFNIENARKHGLKVGSYHFLRTTSSLKSQFENFKKSARRDEQDLLPLIDFENKGSWTHKQIIDSLEAFAGMIREHYHCEPMIYTMTSFYNSYLSPYFNKYPIFIARYSTSQPQLSNGAQYMLWQYTDQGQVDGIDHAVDMCRFAEGVRLRDIMIGPKALKLNGTLTADELLEEAGAKRQAPKVRTPKKFKSAEKPVQDDKDLSKEEKKKREKALKEQMQEEKRERKLKEKARKDSIKMAEKREKARKDSLENVKKQKKKQLEMEEKLAEEKRKAAEKSAAESKQQKAATDNSSKSKTQVKTTGKTSTTAKAKPDAAKNDSTKNNSTSSKGNDNTTAKATDKNSFSTKKVKNAEQGSTYNQQYPTRRGKK